MAARQKRKWNTEKADRTDNSGFLMKINFPPVLLLLVFLTVQESNAQDSTLYRSERPFALKIGLFSFGADVSMLEFVAIDVNAFMVFAYDYKVRVFLLRGNSTPYIGLGGIKRVLQEGTEEKLLFQVGWQYDLDYGIIQLGVLIAGEDDVGLTKRTLYPVFHLGIRF